MKSQSQFNRRRRTRKFVDDPIVGLIPGNIYCIDLEYILNIPTVLRSRVDDRSMETDKAQVELVSVDDFNNAIVEWVIPNPDGSKQTLSVPTTALEECKEYIPRIPAAASSVDTDDIPAIYRGFGKLSNLKKVVSNVISKKVKSQDNVSNIIARIKAGDDQYFGYEHFHVSNMSDYSIMSDTINDMVAVYNIDETQAADIIQSLTHGEHEPDDYDEDIDDTWLEEWNRRNSKYKKSSKSIQSQLANEYSEIEKLDDELSKTSPFLDIIPDSKIDKDMNKEHSIIRTLDRSKTVGSQYDPSFLAEECIRMTRGGYTIGAVYNSIQEAYDGVIGKDPNISAYQKNTVKNILASMGYVVKGGKSSTSRRKSQLIPQGNYPPTQPNIDYSNQQVTGEIPTCYKCGGPLVKKPLPSGQESFICPVCDTNILNAKKRNRRVK